MVTTWEQTKLLGTLSSSSAALLHKRFPLWYLISAQICLQTLWSGNIFLDFSGLGESTFSSTNPFRKYTKINWKRPERTWKTYQDSSLHYRLEPTMAPYLAACRQCCCGQASPLGIRFQADEITKSPKGAIFLWVPLLLKMAFAWAGTFCIHFKKCGLRTTGTDQKSNLN